MQAATAAAIDWWAERRGSDVGTWIDAYKNSLHERQRTAIAAIVERYQPASLFEVGCHCGPNLVRLAQDVPSLADVFGIDASAQAIEAGQAWVKEAGLDTRVRMQVGRFPDDTAAMPDRCAEVVLSCYALAYFSPADLDAALYEVGRLASRVVILAEPVSPMKSTQVSRTVHGYQEYAHAYGNALKWISSMRGMTLRMLDIDPPIDYLNAVLVLERQ